MPRSATGSNLIDNEGCWHSFEMWAATTSPPNTRKNTCSSSEGANLRPRPTPKASATVFTRTEPGRAITGRPQSPGRRPPNRRGWSTNISKAPRVSADEDIAPAPAGVTCSDQDSRPQRRLPHAHPRIHRNGRKCLHGRRDSRRSPTTTRPVRILRSSRNTITTQTGRLIEEWDPRISPTLKETYTYEPNVLRDLDSLTPPGQEPGNSDTTNSTATAPNRLTERQPGQPARKAADRPDHDRLRRAAQRQRRPL